MLGNLLPARRLRISARKVKCPMSRYGNPYTGARPTSSQTVTQLQISVLTGTPHPSPTARSVADPGRRHQVLQLLRANPDREWTPSEIAQELKIARYRSLCGQMCQWTDQGFLDRIGRGRYRLNRQWLAPESAQPDNDSTDGPTAQLRGLA